jgi:hypothetical protein
MYKMYVLTHVEETIGQVSEQGLFPTTIGDNISSQNRRINETINTVLETSCKTALEKSPRRSGVYASTMMPFALQ